MKFNRGLVHSSDDPKHPRDLILVQAKDEEGMWANVREPLDISQALRMATQYAADNRCTVRVVKGPKRDVIRVVEP